MITGESRGLLGRVLDLRDPEDQDWARWWDSLRMREAPDHRPDLPAPSTLSVESRWAQARRRALLSGTAPQLVCRARGLPLYHLDSPPPRWTGDDPWPS